LGLVKRACRLQAWPSNCRLVSLASQAWNMSSSLSAFPSKKQGRHSLTSLVSLYFLQLHWCPDLVCFELGNQSSRMPLASKRGRLLQQHALPPVGIASRIGTQHARCIPNLHCTSWSTLQTGLAWEVDSVYNGDRSILLSPPPSHVDCRIEQAV
jgi:hypothetical protein